MTVATTDKLGDLHGALADAMSDALDAEVERIDFTRKLYEIDTSELDEGTAKHISTAISLAPTARVDNALLKTVASFLKDNDITSELDKGETESAAAQKVRELEGKRRRVALPTDNLLN